MGIMTMGPSSDMSPSGQIMRESSPIIEKIIEVPVEKIIHTKEIIEADLTEVNDKIGNLYVEIYELTEKLELEIQTRKTIQHEFSELIFEHQDKLQSELLKKHEELQTLKMQLENRIQDLKSQYRIQLDDLITSSMSQNQLLFRQFDELSESYKSLQIKIVLIGLGIILFSIIF